MDHIKTFESFINDSNKPNLSKGMNITIEMDDIDGYFSAGEYHIVGLTRGGVILNGMGKKNLHVSFSSLNSAGYSISEE